MSNKRPPSGYKARSKVARRMVGVASARLAEHDGQFGRDGDAATGPVFVALWLDGLDMDTLAALKAMLKAGPVATVFDKSGLILTMRENTARGMRDTRHSTDAAMAELSGVKLPDGMAWADFSPNQIVVLRALTDGKQRTDDAVAALAGIEPSTVMRWCGEPKFRAALDALTEAGPKALAKSKLWRNINVGLDSDDPEKTNRLAAEALGEIGRAATRVERPGAHDARTVEDVRGDIENLSAQERAELAAEFRDVAENLAVDRNGRLTGAPAKE